MIEKMSDYQKLAITTAKYPKKYKIIYPALEMVDETVEFLYAHKHKNRIKEAGDCLWPFANFINEVSIDIDGVYEEAIESFKEELFESNFNATMQMIESSAKICGLIKKWMRDEDTKELPSDDKLMEIEFLLIKYLASVIFICGELGVRWQEVAQINIDKLFDRKKRNKISGSGDHR